MHLNSKPMGSFRTLEAVLSLCIIPSKSRTTAKIKRVKFEAVSIVSYNNKGNNAKKTTALENPFLQCRKIAAIMRNPAYIGILEQWRGQLKSLLVKVMMLVV